MENQDIQQLFIRYLSGKCTQEEITLLLREFKGGNNETELKRFILEELEARPDISEAMSRRLKPLLEQAYDTIGERIHEHDPAEMPVIPLNGHRSRRLVYALAAAVAVLLITVLAVFFSRQHQPGRQVPAVARVDDIQPGGTKARLVLANGNSIVLNGEQDSSFTQGTIRIQQKNGQLIYHESNREAPVAYNTLVVPRGGQYELVLGDGTKVWLNAASSIRYPTAFTGRERMVQITGEAYFEVVHNSRMPFRVQAGNEVIEDLGTHFNVSAYPDEPFVKTTLLEGSVRVGNTVLQPGEQAVTEEDGKISIVKNADVESVIAWKNGFFAFSDANLQTVMKNLARWYDIGVAYEPGIDNGQRFSGRIDRSLTLSQVLNGLKQTKAHFKIEADRKVIILP